MADSFVVGMVEVAEGRCLLLNVATNAEPRPDQTSLLTVTVSLLAAQGAYGMPGPEDKIDLESIETDLDQSFAQVCELVVKIAGDGVRRFIYLAPSEVENLESTLARLRELHSPRTFTAQFQTDLEHSILASMLEDARAGWNDIRTIQELEQAGADLSQSREIQYTLLMPSHNAAIDASQGFESDPWHVEIGEPDEVGNWPLTITQVEVVAPDRIAHYSSMFRRVAKSAGGFLDGWGAPIQSDDQREST